MGAPVLEREVGARHQVAHGPRDQHLAGVQAGPDLHTEPVVAVEQLAPAAVADLPARSVEPTMSANSTVASTRPAPAGRRTAGSRGGLVATTTVACRPSGTASSSMIQAGQNRSSAPGASGASSQVTVKS